MHTLSKVTHATITSLISGALLIAATAAPAFAAERILSTGGYAKQLQKMDMMKMMDADKNHEVSRTEFLDHHRAVFVKMDSSSDQQIDAQEWVAKVFAGK